MTGRSLRLQQRDSLMAAMASEGRTAAQISKATGCNLATVYQWARNARVALMSEFQHRSARVAELAAQGKTSSEIASALNLSTSAVLSWARTNNVRLTKKTRAPVGSDAQAARIAAMYTQGVTLQKIGDEFGVTRERARQILAKQGITGKNGGAVKAASVKRSAAQARKEASCIVKYGFPLDVMRELRKERVLHAYRQQQRNANARAVGWELTFAEWFAIWQASGKLHLRGRGKGKYVMSRIRDDGSYAVGNVHIQLADQNSRDAVKVWKGKSKENRGVYCLYPGRRLAWLAKVGKTSLGYFETEQEAVAARCRFMDQNPEVAQKIAGRGYYICTTKKGTVRYQVMVGRTYVGTYPTPLQALAARADFLAAHQQATTEA